MFPCRRPVLFIPSTLFDSIYNILQSKKIPKLSSSTSRSPSESRLCLVMSAYEQLESRSRDDTCNHVPSRLSGSNGLRALCLTSPPHFVWGSAYTLINPLLLAISIGISSSNHGCSTPSWDHCRSRNADGSSSRPRSRCAFGYVPFHWPIFSTLIL
jgi:hypothetical protein